MKFWNIGKKQYILSRFMYKIFKSMYLFCFWTNLKTIYGAKSPNTIFFSPRQKKISKKLPKNLKIRIFAKIQIYRTPFTFFDKKWVRKHIFYFHPIFRPKNTHLKPEKYHFLKFWKNQKMTIFDYFGAFFKISKNGTFSALNGCFSAQKWGGNRKYVSWPIFYQKR